MGDKKLNDLDRRILHLLQVDARRTRDSDIASDTEVTGTTVANRIEKLEERGIIRGYHPEIDYEPAGYPLKLLFICTAPIADRSVIAEQALEIRGVINVRQLMVGEENVHVQAVAESTDRVEEVAEQLDRLGLTVHESTIVSTETVQPWNHFHLELGDEKGRPAETTHELDE